MGVLDAQLVIMLSLGGVTWVLGATPNEAAVLAERRDNRHVICSGATGGTGIFDNVQTSSGAHSGVALLQLSEAAASGQYTTELLRKGVVSIPRAGAGRPWAAVDVGSPTAVFAADAAAPRKTDPATTGAA